MQRKFKYVKLCKLASMPHTWDSPLQKQKWEAQLHALGIYETAVVILPQALRDARVLHPTDLTELSEEQAPCFLLLQSAQYPKIDLVNCRVYADRAGQIWAQVSRK